MLPSRIRQIYTTALCMAGWVVIAGLGSWVFVHPTDERQALELNTSAAPNNSKTLSILLSAESSAVSKQEPIFHTIQNQSSTPAPRINTTAHVMALGISALIIILCVIVHYEALRLWSINARKIPIKPRLRILLGIFYITTLHFVEIWFFAFGYAYMDSVDILGELVGAAHDGMLEYVYFSAVCYSTLGFGDIIPHGPLRLLSAAEALLGLIMITWSASYTYLQMQRDWHPGKE